MGPPFYHADRRGELSAGEVLELNWDLTIYGKDDTYALDSPYENLMRNEFPQGLSAHGVRYIHSFYEIDHNQRYYQQHPLRPIPTPVANSEKRVEFIENGRNEWFAERVRRDHFSEERSRLQSYFAWPNEESSDGFGHADYNIVEVEPEDYEIRECLDASKSVYMSNLLGSEAGKGKCANINLPLHEQGCVACQKGHR